MMRVHMIADFLEDLDSRELDDRHVFNKSTTVLSTIAMHTVNQIVIILDL